METIVELIAFVVTILLLWRYLVPPVRVRLRKQQEIIRQQIKDSEDAKTRLAQAEKKHADAVNEARVEAAKIRDNARADALRIAEEMKEQADAEVVRIKQRGEEQLGLQRQQLIRELRAELGGDSAKEAERLVRTHLSKPDAQAFTVDRFLDELEDMSGAVESTEPATSTSTRGEA